MNRAEFIKEVETTLDVTEPLNEASVLADVPDYDSLAILNLLSLFDGLGVATTPEQVSDARTVGDLISIAGAALSDA